MTPPAEAIVRVQIADLPEVKELVERLMRERDEALREAEEWEERYDELLASVGGVSPG